MFDVTGQALPLLGALKQPSLSRSESFPSEELCSVSKTRHMSGACSRALTSQASRWRAGALPVIMAATDFLLSLTLTRQTL